jgi:hypothetical protein
MVGHKDQALLVAALRDGTQLILAVLGDWLETEVDGFGFGNDLDRYFRQDQGNLPGGPGLYVWDGVVFVSDIADPAKRYDGSWRPAYLCGAWRPAVLGDFVRFGLPVPPPRLTERAPIQ